MRPKRDLDGQPVYAPIMSQEAWNNFVLDKDIPSGRAVTTLPRNAVPADRTFRTAWKPDLTVDMPKARVVQQDRLREVRASRLAELDVAQLRAIAADDKQEVAAIEAEKQQLRDAPNNPAINAATTPEQLKAVTLDSIVPRRGR